MRSITVGESFLHRPSLRWILASALAVALILAAGARADAQLVLTQESDENDVNTIHSVTATASDGEDPLVGIAVEFNILSGPNMGASGACFENLDCTTDSAGVVGFSYLGAGGPGVDAIQAFFVQNETDTTFSNILEKTWVAVNQPPVAVCEDVTVFTGEDNCEADASIDAGSYDPDEDPITIVQEPAGPYPLGDTVVNLIVTDDSGAADTCTATVTVVDNTPPTISVDLTPDSLWPPNHKLVEVCAEVTVSDNCDESPVWELINVTSSEGDEVKKGGGDGNTKNDIQDADAEGCVLLRAERRGNGDGRVYTLEFTATDASGNSTTITEEVTVAHDQGKKDDDGDDGDDGDGSQDADAGDRELDLLSETGEVWVDVFDVQGRKIRTFVHDGLPRNFSRLGWDGRMANGVRAPRGIYFYRIQTPTRQLVKKILLTR